MSENLERLNWILESRTKIQRLCYMVLTLLKKQRVMLSPEKFKERRGILALTVGASFSLWRAAFLADGVREWKNILDNAEEYLEKMVRDYAINYEDDWAKREWAYTYYLNNAVLRMRDIATRFPAYKEALEKQKLLDLLNGDVAELPPTPLWDRYYEALSLLVQLLEKP